MKTLSPNEIHKHDSLIRAVRLFPESGCVEMLLDYPEDWASGTYGARLVRFHDAYGYKEHEGRFYGSPTALGATSESATDGWHLVHIDTNAGYREMYCKSISIQSLPGGG